MTRTESALLDAVTDAVVVTDERGRIDMLNAAAERMFGYRAADVAGEALELLVTEQDGSGEPALGSTDGALADPPGREVRARRASGELFPASLSRGALEVGGCPRTVSVIRDLSAEKAAAARIRSLEARISRLSRLYLLGELGSSIAHEVNQPLSAIATYAQAAVRIAQSDRPDMNRLVSACRKIDQQARRAGQIVHEMRRLIREPQLKLDRLDVNEVVGDLLPLIEAAASAEGVTVTADYAPNLPAIRGDAIQLQKVVLNLVHNSIDAMRENPADARRLRIATAPSSGPGVRISVTDCGPGIPDTLQASVFDPFVTTKDEHVGLGLSMSRAIVRAHGGSLEHERGPGRETSFVLTLPANDEGAVQ